MFRMIAGLGNPGLQYARTRHNAGFMTVDLLGERLSARYWKDEAGSHTASVNFDDGIIVLAKPLTYMNVSGRAIRRLSEKYEVKAPEVVVVHDDIDIPAGLIRVKQGGGHGGHNGLRSITDELGSNEYVRIRVGVGRPFGRMSAADYVLQPLSGQALEEFTQTVEDAADCVMYLLNHGLPSAMQEFNSRS